MTVRLWFGLGLAALSVSPPVRLSAQDSAATIRFSGYFQPRFQTHGDSAVFLLRRARVALDGQMTSWASFRAQIEMRTTGAAAIPANSPLTISATDIFIRLTHQRWTGTIGQFRVPFSLESIISSGVLETTERSMIVVAARRDIGVQTEWRVPNRVALQAAVVNGEGPNRATNPDNRMAYFARAMVTATQGLELGAAFAGYSDSSGFDLQGSYQRGRLHARAEYIRVHLDPANAIERGWYVLGAYMVRPSRFQLVARVEQYDPRDNVATDRVTGYSLGGQYFFKGDALKLMADYEAFREQVAQLHNDRAVVQLQVRW